MHPVIIVLILTAGLTGVLSFYLLLLQTPDKNLPETPDHSHIT